MVDKSDRDELSLKYRKFLGEHIQNNDPHQNKETKWNFRLWSEHFYKLSRHRPLTIANELATGEFGLEEIRLK